jgi:hypothetical protein
MPPLNHLALAAATVTPLARTRLQRVRQFSNFNEESILQDYVDALLPRNHHYTAVDLGAGDGVRHSNTHALFTSGWKGLAVDGDADRSYRLARAYRYYPNVFTCRHRITPENVVSLLDAYEIPSEFEVLSIDIDSYDYWVLDALLGKFRPRIVVTEINEKIPPPIRFIVKYDPDFTLQHHFFGYSIASLEDLCARHNYALMSLEYNNAFIAPRELPRVSGRDAATVYREGYLDRPDRRKKFPLNQDMEVLHSMSPAAGLKFLSDFYARHTGKYELSAGKRFASHE